MHRLLLDVLESHPRYKKIAPEIQAAFPSRESDQKMYFNDVLTQLRAIKVKGGANSTKDALLHHFVAAARFDAFSKHRETIQERLRKYVPLVRKGLKAQTLNEWDRFEGKVSAAAKTGNAGVIMTRMLSEIVGAFSPGTPK